MTTTSKLEFIVSDFPNIFSYWCKGMWFVSATETVTGPEERNLYLRNDGQVFETMQENVLDLNGGTYFLTQQDAQDCLDRYNAAQNDQNQDTQA